MKPSMTSPISANAISKPITSKLSRIGAAFGAIGGIGGVLGSVNLGEGVDDPGATYGIGGGP